MAWNQLMITTVVVVWHAYNIRRDDRKRRTLLEWKKKKTKSLLLYTISILVSFPHILFNDFSPLLLCSSRFRRWKGNACTPTHILFRRKKGYWSGSIYLLWSRGKFPFLFIILVYYKCAHVYLILFVKIICVCVSMCLRFCSHLLPSCLARFSPLLSKSAIIMWVKSDWLTTTHTIHFDNSGKWRNVLGRSGASSLLPFQKK